MDDYRDTYSYRHVTVVLKLTYTGKLQTLNVELIVHVLFYLEGAWMFDIEPLYNLGAEEPFENLNLYTMRANFYRDRFMDQKMQYIDWKLCILYINT